MTLASTFVSALHLSHTEELIGFFVGIAAILLGVVLFVHDRKGPGRKSPPPSPPQQSAGIINEGQDTVVEDSLIVGFERGIVDKGKRTKQRRNVIARKLRDLFQNGED